MEPRARCNDAYLRQVIAPQARRWTEHLATSLWQLPRIALAVFLSLWLSIGSDAYYLMHRGPRDQLEPVTSPLFIGLWILGMIILLVELTMLVIREVMALPWPGPAPTTIGIFLRSMAATVVLFLCVAGQPMPIVAFPFAVAVALVMFGLRLPAAWRGLRILTRARRSLSVAAPARWLGTLRGQVGQRGRQLVFGRLSRDEGDGFSLEHEGVTARFEEPRPELIELAIPGPQTAVLARVHVDGDGYRAAGVRLESGGLPVWILPVEEGVLDQLAPMRRRLGASTLLDGALLVTAGVGVVVLAAFLATLREQPTPRDPQNGHTTITRPRYRSLPSPSNISEELPCSTYSVSSSPSVCVHSRAPRSPAASAATADASR